MAAWSSIILIIKEETDLLILLLNHTTKSGYDSSYLILTNEVYQFMYLLWCFTVTAIHLISRGNHFL